MHGNYFDLRVLSSLSRRVSVVLTLHDAWLISGHCAHSFDCDRWQTGCGQCPDLGIYPAIRRDATAQNWQRKRDIFAQSRLYVSTPCQWLMSKVKSSILYEAAAETRVIPYGVDLSVFRPVDRAAVRAELGLEQDALVLTFAANGIRKNVFKDYQTMRGAVQTVAERSPQRKLIFLGLGEDAPTERIGRAQVRFIPFERDAGRIARYYQAADLYVHAARVDTFPNAVLEALACGTPVVATAVGGIPEQVKALPIGAGPHDTAMTPGDATGALTPLGDVRGMAFAIELLLKDGCLRQRLGENAARDARRRFDLGRQADAYLEWYRELLGGTNQAKGGSSLPRRASPAGYAPSGGRADPYL